MDSDAPRDLLVRGDMIRLGQLLKLAGLVDAGGELKALLASDRVLVNGAAEARRGRQLGDGDTVRVGEDAVRVVTGG